MSLGHCGFPKLHLFPNFSLLCNCCSKEPEAFITHVGSQSVLGGGGEGSCLFTFSQRGFKKCQFASEDSSIAKARSPHITSEVLVKIQNHDLQKIDNEFKKLLKQNKHYYVN